MLEELREQLKKAFGLSAERYDTNMLLLEVERQSIQEVLRFLKEAGFTYAHTVSVVDYTPKGGGFQVNYILEDTFEKKFVIVRTEAPAEDPKVPSACGIYPPLQPHEREAWEMFGVEFTGNPRLEVMLLPEWAEGLFPLRKSYVFEKHRKRKK